MDKIGFFGGSFNPPTIAHLKIVETSLKEFGLDKLVIVPMGDKYEKSELISFSTRYNMLKETFKNYSNVEISKLQENQAKRTYAIDTFYKIDELYKTSENFFIMGLDNFANIHKWKGADELLKKYKYIVFKRNEAQVPEYGKNAYYIDISCNTSSSDAREKIKNNENLDNILPKNVIKFIDKNDLYK